MNAVASSFAQSPSFLRRTPKTASGSILLTSTSPGFIRFGSGPQFRHRVNSSCLKLSRPSQSRTTSLKSRTSFVVKASASGDSSSDSIAPLQLKSPVGQFLSQILVSHPHLVPAAVEQQLEQLQIDREAEQQINNKDSSSSPLPPATDIVLYRRIAEVKEKERRRALEEILYALVVQKFMDANVSLVPSITSSSGRVDTWPTQEDGDLEQLHSPEVYEMIQNHLSIILKNREGDLSTVAQISKLGVGQVYAASVMYGYFLKRIDQRFQLEKTMKILPGGSDVGGETSIEQAGREAERSFYGEAEEETYQAVSSMGGINASGGSSSETTKQSRLKTYVMSFDGETLQRYATIRSREAVGIIEKHTEALFGRAEIVITPQGIDSSKDEHIKISFKGLKRLVLEAVTFGSFLWDVESHVDSRYHFVLN
ncbi:UV-B-induced protein At3g17800, chloroplastic isoform X1 [Raphanus sativus]|uniref:UV-B-induced protein At3g17800, chloroplastic isoform X1 n=1 Tax=Raphanus sativus TaxID=3726 RepID=A0A6J0P5F6_RAPSA|nr:UV-B-induced protein At3g17800, chloroplastic isoform X1 [Raphanus sativus]